MKKDSNTGDWNTSNRNTGDSNTGNSNTGNWNTGNWNTGNWNTSNRNTGDSNTGNSNTGNWNTGNWNTGNWNTSNSNTGDRNTGNWNTGNRNTGNWNTGNWNTGNSNTGNWNTGNWNTGAFCTQNGSFTLFDKPTSMKREEFFDIINSLSEYPQLTLWIEEGYMSATEKEENPSYKTTGGYLKKLDYKEAHSIWWSNLSQEDKDKITGLPNFDSEKFKAITGIDTIEKPEDSKIKLTLRKIEELESELAKLKAELKK